MCSVTQSYLTLCNPMDCSLPHSSVHGIFQERILEWVTISYSGYLPEPGIKPHFLHLQHWQTGSLTTASFGKPHILIAISIVLSNLTLILHPHIAREWLFSHTFSNSNIIKMKFCLSDNYAISLLFLSAKQRLTVFSICLWLFRLFLLLMFFPLFFYWVLNFTVL